MIGSSVFRPALALVPPLTPVPRSIPRVFGRPSLGTFRCGRRAACRRLTRPIWAGIAALERAAQSVRCWPPAFWVFLETPHNGGRQFIPVGVNLDTNKDKVARYLKANPLSWPQLQDSGGLDGQLASSLGVLTLPTMILLDEKGNVVNRNAHTSDVDDYLDKHLSRQASRR